MSCSLFMQFDPGMFYWSFWFSILSWSSIMMTLMLVNWKIYAVSTGVYTVYDFIVTALWKGLKKLSPLQFHSLCSLFVFMVVINLQGLSSFSVTTHFLWVFSLSVFLWMSGIIEMAYEDLSSVIAHLVPEGSPLLMGPFLVTVEFISQLMRPLSLALRMSGNMLVGHMMIHTMSEITHSCLTSAVSGMVALVWEMGVLLVQSFVFMTLMSLYWSEVSLSMKEKRVESHNLHNFISGYSKSPLFFRTPLV